MIKKILSLFIITLTMPFIMNGQVHNNGSIVFVNGNIDFSVNGDFVNFSTPSDSALTFLSTDSRLTVNGDLLNRSGLVINHGELNINGDYTASINASLDTSLFYNLGIVRLTSDFNVADGYYGDSITSKFYLEGAGVQNLNTGTGAFINHLVIDGGGDKYLGGNVYVDTIALNNGIVYQVGANDSLLVIFGKPINYSASSYVDGTLLINGIGDVMFPIGTNGKFRPIQMKAVADTNLLIASVSDQPIPATAGGSLKKVANNIHWILAVGNENVYTPTKIELFYDLTTDTAGLGIANVQVSEAWPNPTGEYFPRGGVNSPSSFPGLTSVVSTYNVSDSGYFALGKGCDVKVAMNVLLEGAYNSATGTMYTSLQSAGILDSVYAFGGPWRYNMIPGQSVPVNAVDRIDLILRNSGTFGRVDTSYAWLISDGSIRDFETGDSTNVAFCNAQIGNDYHIEVAHRNHLSAMTSSTFTAANSSSFIDMTGANGSNVYGIGYISLYNGALTINESGLIGGKTKWYNSPWQQITSSDYLQVYVDLINNKIGKYERSDVNLTGGIEATDINLVRDNSIKLRYSTAP